MLWWFSGTERVSAVASSSAKHCELLGRLTGEANTVSGVATTVIHCLERGNMASRWVKWRDLNQMGPQWNTAVKIMYCCEIDGYRYEANAHFGKDYNKQQKLGRLLGTTTKSVLLFSTKKWLDSWEGLNMCGFILQSKGAHMHGL